MNPKGEVEGTGFESFLVKACCFLATTLPDSIRPELKFHYAGPKGACITFSALGLLSQQLETAGLLDDVEE